MQYSGHTSLSITKQLTSLVTSCYVYSLFCIQVEPTFPNKQRERVFCLRAQMIVGVLKVKC